MMRPMRTTVSVIGTTLLILVAACGGDGGTTTPQDMASGGTTGLTGLPANCAAGVTADKLFNDTYKASCVLSGCHGDNASTFSAKTVAELKGLVGKAAAQTTKMPLVTAGDPNKSYLMYKMMGQQAKAGGSGSLMPLGSPQPQAAAELCKYLVWIQEGAK